MGVYILLLTGTIFDTFRIAQWDTFHGKCWWIITFGVDSSDYTSLFTTVRVLAIDPNSMPNCSSLVLYHMLATSNRILAYKFN